MWPNEIEVMRSIHPSQMHIDNYKADQTHTKAKQEFTQCSSPILRAGGQMCLFVLEGFMEGTSAKILMEFMKTLQHQGGLHAFTVRK